MFPLGEAEIGEHRLGEDALVRHVVDRENGLWQRLVGRRESLEVGRDERRRPIVHVHHVDLRAGLLPRANELGDGAREGREAEGVVGVVLAALAVDGGPIEEARQVDEHEVDLRGEATVEERGFEGAAAELELEGREAPREQEAAGLEASEPRQDQGDRMAQAFKGLRQGAADVGEAANFDERGKLSGRDEDFHWRRPFYHGKPSK